MRAFPTPTRRRRRAAHLLLATFLATAALAARAVDASDEEVASRYTTGAVS